MLTEKGETLEKASTIANHKYLKLGKMFNNLAGHESRLL